VRVLTCVLAGGIVFASGAFVALANDAPSPTPHVRIPDSVLRHVDAQTLEVPPTPRPDTHAKEVVILVEGYESCACLDDHAFDLLRDRLVASGFDVVSFGKDPRHPYDTLGRIEPSAISLRDEARELGHQYAGVHIVTHSMGGVIADRAFVDGLSAADGVLTYVAWSAPHDGSDAALAVDIVRAAHGDMDVVRSMGRQVGNEPDSAATRDLAVTRAPPPPPGVVRLDLREANDWLVNKWDARDPGVPSRILQTRRPGLQELDGHGAILLDPNATDLTVRTITTRRVPPDDRGQELIEAAQQESNTWSRLALIGLCVLTAAICVRALTRRNVDPILSLVRRVIPPPERCP
jgi:hypothetical protein